MRVAWVNVAKLDAAWKLDDECYFIPPGPYELHSRYGRIPIFLETHKGPIWMPTVSPTAGGAVGFTDGRHRFAWMRDHGVKHMPVGTGWQEFDEIGRASCRERV